MLRKSITLLVATLLLAGCGERTAPKLHDGLRVVAMAPSTAEILYALGLSNEVVGVSRFCSYPPDVTNKPAVGGLYDPNWEMIVALQPDFVIGLETQKEIETQLKALGIGFIGVSHEHIAEILQSILAIGKACGAEAEAQKLFQRLEKQLADIFKGRARSPSEPRTSRRDVPTVLVCVGHDESLSRMYVAARGTFYDELIDRAGGINACEKAGGYPEISPEGLASMNPDVVIDILPASLAGASKRPANIGNFTSNAWRPHRAVVMTNDYAWIPGPRFVLLLEDFAVAIRQNNFEAE
ncbi:MAG: helical backbone metal receptor [Kiritimatiellales bacterium]